ncbi:MAG: HEAT repeat domain-containing protein [Gemmatimonadaceae bacterium]
MTKVILAIALLAAPPVLGAQSLASRVASAPAGVVRMQFDARPGVCGDGRDVVAYGNAFFGRNFQSIGRWSGVRCEGGPLRVTVTVADGDVRQVRTQIGGTWPATGAQVTDLGVVSADEASAYFLSLVPRLERGAGKDRVLLPAVLADAPVVDRLFALARDEERVRATREQALHWLGILGDPQARRMLHTVIEDVNEDRRIRANAIHALANGSDLPASEIAYLRSLYGRVDDVELKEAVIFAMHRDESENHWLIERAMDRDESLKLRKSALFWAGQREATRTVDLLRVYREVREPSLREHAIFVLSQRHDDAATDMLLDIARGDDDKELRGKALFWLAQKDDPRVRKLIADLLLK